MVLSVEKNTFAAIKKNLVREKYTGDYFAELSPILNVPYIKRDFKYPSR